MVVGFVPLWRENNPNPNNGRHPDLVNQDSRLSNETRNDSNLYKKSPKHTPDFQNQRGIFVQNIKVFNLSYRFLQKGFVIGMKKEIGSNFIKKIKKT